MRWQMDHLILPLRALLISGQCYHAIDMTGDEVLCYLVVDRPVMDDHTGNGMPGCYRLRKQRYILHCQ